MIEEKYLELCEKPSDINQLLPTLRKYAMECDHVTEMGVRWVVSTWALLAARPKKLVSYDVRYHQNIEPVKQAAKENEIDFSFIQADVLKVDIEPTDMLFIDTWHVGKQLREELKLHAGKVNKYLAFHDTTTFGTRGEDGSEGLWPAIQEFLDGNPAWSIQEKINNNNGLTVLVKGQIIKDHTRIPDQIKKKLESNPVNLKSLRPDKKLKFIVPCPDVPYYDWQILVQINNFAKYGYDVDTHYLIGTFNNIATDNIRKISNSKDIRAKFHFYNDDRLPHQKMYTASLKPYLMMRYFQQHPWEKDCAYVYLDPDVIYLEEFDFSPYIPGDDWYGSDVGSYLDSNYIKSKGGEELLKEFCDHVGISTETVIANDKNCIGAQYLTKNNTPEFWQKVFEKSCDTFNYLTTRKGHYFKPEMTYWLQTWTMEMWTTIWQLWIDGVKTRHTNDWCFAWANHKAKTNVHKIFHNAGVAKNNGVDFCKIDFQSSPFRKEIHVDESSLSLAYLDEVRQTEKNYPDLIWD